MKIPFFSFRRIYADYEYELSYKGLSKKVDEIIRKYCKDDDYTNRVPKVNIPGLMEEMKALIN